MIFNRAFTNVPSHIDVQRDLLRIPGIYLLLMLLPYVFLFLFFSPLICLKHLLQHVTGAANIALATISYTNILSIFLLTLKLEVFVYAITFLLLLLNYISNSIISTKQSLECSILLKEVIVVFDHTNECLVENSMAKDFSRGIFLRAKDIRCYRYSDIVWGHFVIRFVFYDLLEEFYAELECIFSQAV